LEKNNNDIKNKLWAITPVFIPSAKEFDKSTLYKSSGESLTAIAPLPKFVTNIYHNEPVTYTPRFSLPDYTFPENENENNKTIWVRDIVLHPKIEDLGNDNKAYKYVQLKIRNDNSHSIYVDDLPRLNSNKTEILNTKAYIAPAFTIRPKRNAHPNDDWGLLESISEN
jgi:competence transcription factor ComK